MPLRGKRVLLVEDEILIAMMAEQMLTDMGASIVGPSQTVAEAMELAKRADIDLALLDVNLNGERIDPVLVLLRERGIPVVLATGYGAMAQGVPADIPLIEKPYSEAKLRLVMAT